MKVLVDNPSEHIKVSDITDDLENTIIVCGSFIDLEIYQKAKKVAIKQQLETECTPIKKKYLWEKQKYKCPIKTEK